MEDTPKPNGLPPTTPCRKGCHISIMFPVDDDEAALAIKKQIDEALPDVDGKRYTFQITEM